MPVSIPETPRAEERPTFYAALTGVLSFPFAGSGPVLVICGAIFFSILQWASYLAAYAPLYGFLALIILNVMGGGYTFSYLQEIILSSSRGEKSLPAWPEIASMWESFVAPFFRGLCLALIFLAPGVMVMAQSSELGGWLVLVLSGFFLPMALLAVVMADSFSGLNPLVVLSAIAKLIGPYMAACVALGMVCVLATLLQVVARRIPIPLLPTLLANLFAMYGLTVSARIIGLLYYTNEEKLGWF